MSTSAQAQATEPITKAARRLQQEAQGHMKLSRQHRDRAATLYRELDELIARCAECGIEVTLVPITNAQGGASGDDRSKPRRNRGRRRS